DSSVRVWVSVAISPSFIKALITSAAERPRLSATSLTVAPELILIAGVSSGCFGAFSSGSSSSGRRRRPPRRRGGRGGGRCLAMWSRRAACESITTRRRFLAGPLRAGAEAPSPPLGFESAFGAAPALGASEVFFALESDFAGAAVLVLAGAAFVAVALEP